VGHGSNGSPFLDGSCGHSDLLTHAMHDDKLNNCAVTCNFKYTTYRLACTVIGFVFSMFSLFLLVWHYLAYFVFR